MVSSCAAYGCKNRYKKGSGITFHCIPRDETLRKKWTAAMGRPDFVVSKYSKICSIHFSKADFTRGILGKLTINSDAVPAIFNSSSHRKKERRQARSNCIKSQSATVDQDEEMQCDDPVSREPEVVNEVSDSFTDNLNEKCMRSDTSVCDEVEKETHEEHEAINNVSHILSNQQCNAQSNHLCYTEVVKETLEEHETSNEVTDAPSGHTKKKCMKNRPTYLEDIDDTFIENATPEDLTRLWKLCCRIVVKQKKRIGTVFQKNRRMHMRIKAAQDMLKSLKENTSRLA